MKNLRYKFWSVVIGVCMIIVVGVPVFFSAGCAEKMVEEAAIVTIAPPANLSALATTLQVTLSWEAVAEASSYNLYWSNTSGVTKANGTKIAGATSPYAHTGLTNGLTYYYVATALDAQNNESIESNQAVATPEIIGVLDTNFNSDGVVTHNSAAGGNGRDYGYSITTDSSGRILVAGYSYNGTDNDLAIWRYDSNGNLDTTNFNPPSGFVIHNNAAGGNGNDSGWAITIDSSGRILVAGHSHNGTDSDMAIWRYDSNGNLDTTNFNPPNGFVIHHNAAGGNSHDGVKSITTDSSGRILVAGYSHNGADMDMAIWRYDSDGNLDTTNFNPPNGFVIHHNAAGGNSGDYGQSITTDSSGRILVAGYSDNGTDNDLAIWRYDSDGSLDTSFDSDGVVFHNSAAGGNGHDFGYSITTDSSGKILVAGGSYNGTDDDLAIWRYDSDGSPDTSFDSDGIVFHNNAAGGNGNDYGCSITTDSSGRILVAGYSHNGTDDDMAIWRYDSDGSPDTSFDSDGVVFHNNAAGGNGHDEGWAITTDSSGRILVAGYSHNGMDYDMAIWRYK